MFRLITIVLVLGVAIYKVVYGSHKDTGPQPQTSGQPLGSRKKIESALPISKPEVILGEPLTDEEWEMLKNASHVVN